jgi:putative ABC transport system permease protein
MVVVTALLGMAAVILSGLNERRREMAILRAMGAGPRTIMGLLVAEAITMAGVGAGLGVAFLYGALMVVQPWLDAAYGLFIPITGISVRDASMLGTVLLAAAFISLVPALRAYRMSLTDGMMVKT